MPKRPYGKVCRRDVTKIRDVVRKQMRVFAKEWAETHPGAGFNAWRAFLSEKLKAAIKAIPVTCD